MAASDVATAKDDDSGAGGGGSGSNASDLQQHLQLDACDGKYLTRQEILLLELYQSFHQDGAKGSNALASTGLSAFNDASSHASSTAGSNAAAIASAGSTSAITKPAGGAAAAATNATTPKRQLSSDRERVQHFLLQRQHGPSAGASSASSVTPKSFAGASSSSSISGASSSSSSAAAAAAAALAKDKQPAMSAVERAKLVMAKKVAPTKPVGTMGATSAAGKRTNPLTDILRGGSGSIVGSASTAKRLRTKSDKPGEIRIQGGRSSIQLPLESFLRTEDWDSATAPALDLVLPEVAFATNNTLIVHATMPVRASRFCFNISTQTSMLSGAPYPGTVLYHFNPRRQRGGVILQNSNIDGRWGCVQPLPRCPITFGEPFTLRLTVVRTGFLVFLEELFQDEFRHRVPIREGENLVLTVPTRDESGHAEGVVVHSVWWGHAEAPANMDHMRRSSGVHGGPSGFNRNPRGSTNSYEIDRSGSSGNSGSLGTSYRGGSGGGGSLGGRSGSGGSTSDRFQGAPHPFEVYVGNLPQGTSREELSFLFQYLGFETVRITARGFGFVTLRSADAMHRAVEDLDGRDFNGMKLRVSCALPPK